MDDKLVEELAEAMAESAYPYRLPPSGSQEDDWKHGDPWADSGDISLRLQRERWRGAWRRAAHAALAFCRGHYGLPEGAKKGCVRKAVEALKTLMPATCTTGCKYGGYPYCKEATGLFCSVQHRADIVWPALCLLTGEGEEAGGG